MAAVTVSCNLQGEDEQLNGWQSGTKGSLSCLAYASAPSMHNTAVRVSLSACVAAEFVRRSSYVDHEYLRIISTLMARDSRGQKSDAQMWAMKLEGYGLQGKMSVRLQELMQGVALPETISDIIFLVPHGHLTLAEAKPTRASKTATRLIKLVEQVQQDSLASMQPEKPLSRYGQVRLGNVGLGDKGMLSVFFLLDEQQMPWIFFIHTQPPDDRAATTAKDVVCSLEDNLSGFTTLPQLSPPAWRNWHRGPDDMPTKPMQAKGAATAKSNPKLPFDRVVYIYVPHSALSPAEQSTLRQVVAAGHPWLQRTIVYSSSIRNGYFRRMGAWSNDALRHAILQELR